MSNRVNPSCVTCDHPYGKHQANLGPCTVDGCECRGFLHASANAYGPIRVVTPEQLRDGYVVQRGIGDFDVRRYAVIRRLDDGSYLVRDPCTDDG